MCLGRRSFPRRARIFLALGYLCMFTGVMLSRFSSGTGAQHANTIHFLMGFLLGITITFLFAAMYLARRDQHVNHPPNC